MSGSVVRIAARAVSDLLISIGVLLLLYIVYSLWWTDVVAHRAAQGNVCELGREWARAEPVAPRVAKPFATLQIPEIRNPQTWPVLDGVQQTELRQGVGWYPGSQLPGQAGNFAVAAHRRTWGDIFRYLNEVKTGDSVVVREGGDVYTYRIMQTGVYLPPTAVEVLSAIPAHSGFSRPGSYITLTTCDPVYNAYRRLVVFGELVSRRTTDDIQAC
jgi:sortase A